MQGKIAIVTGGSRGIGRAICIKLATRGATVVSCARDVAKLDDLASEALKRELPGTIDAQLLDVSDRDAIDPFIDAVAERHGRVDILVNNAGITRDGLCMNMEDSDFDDVLTTNLRSAFWLSRAVSRLMIRQRYGRIINIASVSGVMGNAGQANYAASKAGLIGLTKSLAKEVGRRGVTCNVVAPGFVTTDMTANLPDKVKDSVKTLVPLARFGEPEEIANVVSFLASDEASYITGQVILVDGGMCM